MASTSCKNTNESQPETQSDSISTTESNGVEKDTTLKTILFFGDSLTAGYGLDDPDDAFPGLIQDKIDSLGISYQVVNAGISGETTSGGKNRLDWILETNIDIFVLELGANDGLRGIPVAETKANLQYIIDEVKAQKPTAKIVLTGMQLPPNLGTEYTADFKALFYDLAEQNNIALVPFLLENVGGIARLNQADGIHPTAEGHKILAANVFPVLRPLLKSNSTD
ncbi:arylesterase [Leeuwenhoekiella sp. MAR_2009_132]|uniref:arylesterase n=1 Tax=Leeuwenhoekiella sp. MAR_2009_132 TaxID=1392489 RepID=UPI001F181F99|nr:arylesterase [Leeuwenhoekiella sp. MAR_2009_132]